jgi:DNA-binding XRE family transcriptional regulator
MSKRKPIDKAEARVRRNRLLDAAAAAELSLTEGVREMRAIAGMTQEEFAQHRGVSARVIKAIELGQGNPTVATLNRIGEFFGLEVAFVPVRRAQMTEAAPGSASTDAPNNKKQPEPADATAWHTALKEAAHVQESFAIAIRKMQETLDRLNAANETGNTPTNTIVDTAADAAPGAKKRKPRAS